MLARKYQVKRHFVRCGWHHIQLSLGITVQEALREFKDSPEVEAVSPNYIVDTREPAPSGGNIRRRKAVQASAASGSNDLLARQWGLAKICAPEAWKITKGSTNVVIAVLDSGINYLHQDLADNMWNNPGEIATNGIDDDQNGYIDDIMGVDVENHTGDPIDIEAIHHHGTACASIVGASGSRTNGMSGVCPRVQLMAVRLTSIQFSTIANEISGYEYIIAMKRRGVNVKAINYSYAGLSFPISGPEQDALNALEDAGILLITCAGNSANNLDLERMLPATYHNSNIIVVAATLPSDELAPFSGFGRRNVDIAAPGGMEILVASGPGTSDYAQVDGTSVAAPMVAGAIALLASVWPEATAPELKRGILESVDVLPSLEGKVRNGGRLNVGKLLLNRLTNQPPVILASPQAQTFQIGRRTYLSVSAGGTQPIAFQWFKDGQLIPGATNASLVIGHLSGNQSTFSVTASNEFGMAQSDPALVAVSPIVAWGRTEYGECDVPYGLTNIAAIAGGYVNSLALMADGSVVAWGHGALESQDLVRELTNVTAVAAGYEYSLALKSDGTAVSWGIAEHGQETNAPADLTNVIAIAAGMYHSLALKSDGTVVSWGWGDSDRTNVPSGLAGVRAIAAGYSHSLALLTNGTVRGWGQGNGAEIVPEGLSNVVSVVAGRNASLALKADGTVTVWGVNDVTPSGSDNAGLLNVPPGLSNVVAIAGYSAFQVLKRDGTLVAWGGGGSPAYGQASVPAGLSNVSAIASNGGHSLALVPPSGGDLTVVVPPATLKGGVGDQISLSVVAISPTPPQYQWFRNGAALDNATNSHLVFPQAHFGNSGSYSVQITAGQAQACIPMGIVTVWPTTNTPPVEPVNPATIEVLSTNSARELALVIRSTPGATDTIESAAELGAPQWNAVTNIAVTAGCYTWLAPVGPGPQRFYRIATSKQTPEETGIPEGMAFIPAGEYMMGTSLLSDSMSEWDKDQDQMPHLEYVDSFFIDKYELTEGLWNQTRDWALAHGYDIVEALRPVGPSYPVMVHGCDEAAKWCNARSEREGFTPCYYLDPGCSQVFRSGRLDSFANDKGRAAAYVRWEANGYRLPTELEWEKAARAGAENTLFPWGNTISLEQALYTVYGDDPSDPSWDLSAGNEFRPRSPLPVGSFAPNGYGLYDVVGNMAEWCWDQEAATGQDFRRVTSVYANMAFYSPVSYRTYTWMYSGKGGIRCVRGN